MTHDPDDPSEPPAEESSEALHRRLGAELELLQARLLKMGTGTLRSPQTAPEPVDLDTLGPDPLAAASGTGLP